MLSKPPTPTRRPTNTTCNSPSALPHVKGHLPPQKTIQKPLPFFPMIPNRSPFHIAFLPPYCSPIRSLPTLSSAPSPTPQPTTAPFTFPMSSPSTQSCVSILRISVPLLDGRSRKVEEGSIAIIGGSPDYTGAPYLAAMSALRAGADLAHIYSPREAASVIKDYSPDLIVHPGWESLGEGCDNLSRAHVIVIGPGLGRGKDVAGIVEKVLKYCRKERRPVVVDADALWWVAVNETVRWVLKGGGAGWRVYLTPNVVEMSRLTNALNVEGGEGVARWFGAGVVIVEKGAVDKIWGGGEVADVGNSGSSKRCGSLGDILAGCVAVCESWIRGKGVGRGEAAACACLIAKVAAGKAFNKWGRGLVASDVLPYVSAAVEEVLHDGGREREVER